MVTASWKARFIFALNKRDSASADFQKSLPVPNMPVSQVAITGVASRSRYKHGLSTTLLSYAGMCGALHSLPALPHGQVHPQCSRVDVNTAVVGMFEVSGKWWMHSIFGMPLTHRRALCRHGRLNLGTHLEALFLMEILHSLWVWSHRVLFRMMFFSEG